MAYQFDWIGRRFIIPKADLTPTADPLIFELDMAAFHLEVRTQEADFNGGLWSDPVIAHQKGSTFSGQSLADTITVINNFVLEFEYDGVNSYAVNLIGANTNIPDVAVVNGVSIRPRNSIGSQKIYIGSGVTAQDKIDIAEQTKNTILSTEVFP